MRGGIVTITRISALITNRQYRIVSDGPAALADDVLHDYLSNNRYVIKQFSLTIINNCSRNYLA